MRSDHDWRPQNSGTTNNCLLTYMRYSNTENTDGGYLYVIGY